MPYATLPDRRLLRLSGEDTLPFLQGLVSNDVLRLREAGIVYAAMLTPQGKFLHDFFLLPRDGAVLLDCAAGRRDALLQLLGRYRLRSRVAIEALPDSEGVAAIWNETELPGPPGQILVVADPRLAELGWRVAGDKERMEAWCRQCAFAAATAEDYDRHRLALGIPAGDSDMVPEKSFLLPFGFDYLHGVDFNKGCYIGQEVTARSKHIGQVRKMIYRVASRDGDLPEPGTTIYCGETPAGELRSSRGDIGLALLQVEEVRKADAAGQALSCNGKKLEARLPGWLGKAGEI